MPSSINPLKFIVAPLFLSATLALSACGDSGVDQGRLDQVKKQGEAITNDAKALQESAKQAADDVRSGKITAAEAQAAIKKQADAIEAKAKAATSDAIDSVKDNKNLSDADKKQLQDAQDKLTK